MSFGSSQISQNRNGKILLMVRKGQPMEACRFHIPGGNANVCCKKLLFSCDMFLFRPSWIYPIN
ncbi:hypothetical protein XELAEV_18029711mg [Xenopus laevis]|uniref:Uncharacterized protein n=1 Tax=Xenopus laevis TaxID=8355 RepID=A0A974CS36_XENLA|nr:hypothetical protein XELAEV_18029711mg [Xenopus laevis]